MTARLKAVFFAAHPDDVELFALGSLLALQARGWDIGWVIATDGARSHGKPNAEMVERRAFEARRSAELCNAQLVMLGFPDGALAVAADAGRSLHEAMVTLAPDLILTHHPQDYHPDHRAVSRHITEACQPADQLLYAEPILGFGPLPDLLVDVSASFDLKCRALRCHESQAPEAMVRALKSWNGFRAIQTLQPQIEKAEGFMVSARNFSQQDPMKILPAEIVSKRFQSHA